MILVIKLRILSSISCTVIGCVLGLAILSATPVIALTPLRTPEQIVRDRILIARATQIITAKVRRCFLNVSAGRHTSFDVQFFLSGDGQRLTEFSIVDVGQGSAGTGSRAAGSARERSAIKAIRTCAPYIVPEELRTWGGFWVKVAF